VPGAPADAPGDATLGVDGEAPPCQPPRCKVFAEKQSLPSAIALDATGVYWANADTVGSVSGCPISGCLGSPTVLEAAAGEPTSIALMPDRVLYTRKIGTASSVRKLGFDAGSLELPRSDARGGIAYGGPLIFWVVAFGIYRYDFNAAEYFHQGAAVDVATQGGDVWWISTAGEIRKCGVSYTCAVESIVNVANDQTNARNLVVSATHVAWAVGSEIRALSRSALTIETLASGVGAIAGLAIDDEFAYWTDRTGGNLGRVGLRAGSRPEIVVGGLSKPLGIARSTGAAYVAESGAGRILEVTF
jgi:hypothetical protein